MCVILDCPVCDDADCKLNICGLCHDISTLLIQAPSGMVTCSGAVIEFERKDVVKYG